MTSAARISPVSVDVSARAAAVRRPASATCSSPAAAAALATAVSRPNFARLSGSKPSAARAAAAARSDLIRNSAAAVGLPLPSSIPWASTCSRSRATRASLCAHAARLRSSTWSNHAGQSRVTSSSSSRARRSISRGDLAPCRTAATFPGSNGARCHAGRGVSAVITNTSPRLQRIPEPMRRSR